MPLADPIPCRLTPDQVEFLDALAKEHALITRAAALRHLVEAERRRYARRQRQQTAQSA